MTERVWLPDPLGWSPRGYYVLRCAQCGEERAMVDDVDEPYTCDACTYPSPARASFNERIRAAKRRRIDERGKRP